MTEQEVKDIKQQLDELIGKWQYKRQELTKGDDAALDTWYQGFIGEICQLVKQAGYVRLTPQQLKILETCSGHHL